MPFLKKINFDFFLQNNQIILSKEYLVNNNKKFKKITGSRFASVLGKNKYCSPFKIWTIIVGIYKEEMDPTLAVAGQIIEPKIRKYVTDKLNINFKVYDPKKVNWDIFKDNDIFGGIPDGEPINQLGNVDYTNSKPMLEIKTSSYDSLVYEKIDGFLKIKKDAKGLPIVKEPRKKYLSWFNHQTNDLVINLEYQYQLGLYLYLRNSSKGLFAISWLHPKDYLDPYSFNIEEHEVKLCDFSVNLSKFAKEVDKAKEWYNKYVIGGISPNMDENDKLWFQEQINIQK